MKKILVIIIIATLGMGFIGLNNIMKSHNKQNKEIKKVVEKMNKVERQPSINKNDGVADAIRKSIGIKDYFAISKSGVFEMSDGTFWQDITYWKGDRRLNNVFEMKNFGRGFEVYRINNNQEDFLSSKADEGITIVKIIR